MRVLLKLGIAALAIGLSPLVSRDIVVTSAGGAVLAALVYGVLFVLIGWAVRLVVGVLSIVPGVLTLGLFFLLVPTLANMVLLKLTAHLLGGFDIRTWGAAFLLSVALGIVNWLFEGRRK